MQSRRPSPVRRSPATSRGGSGRGGSPVYPLPRLPEKAGTRPSRFAGCSARGSSPTSGRVLAAPSPSGGATCPTVHGFGWPRTPTRTPSPTSYSAPGMGTCGNPPRHHYGAMSIDPLTRAVHRALDEAPCSTRALAVQAGVPHSTLVRIAAGERNATPAVAVALARALRAWGETCVGLAGAIEGAAPSPPKRG